MDKKLFKAYIRTIVEEEVERILPKLLSEAVSQVKAVNENNSTPTPVQEKPTLDRSRLAAMMGLEYDGDTIRAMGGSVIGGTNFVDPNAAPPEITNKINRDYSEHMKKLNLT